MLLYDGIVFSLQRTGGISVLFTEIISRLPLSSYELTGAGISPPARLQHATYRFEASRRFERYRRARATPRCELFHSTYYRLPDNDRCRVVTTVYDFIYERFAPLLTRSVHSIQKRRAMIGADRIICISESTRRDLVDFAGSAIAERAVVIPLGVSELFHPIPATPVLPQVLFVGSRIGHKNFASVPPAIAGLPDLRLVCVGGGPFTPDEVALLERNIPGRYRATGYLSIAELNLEYNRSLCLAYVSHFEGFGIPVLEAMRAGCPVIAVNASSMPEVAGNAAILLSAGAPDEVRAAIEHVAAASVREELRTKGVAHAEHFTWDRTFMRTVAVYEDLLGKPVADGSADWLGGVTSRPL